MAEQLTLGSLFDGSGGFPLGGILSGIAPVWASEIEPFAVRVTTKRLPFMKHYGDVSALSGAELPPVDIITFGSPCQDMSVAGKRAGLDGSRSNLFYEAVRIAKEMREATNGRYPTWLCWENVPGAFSSNSGSDFKAVLDEIRRIKDPEADTPRPAKWPNAGCILADSYSVAWRVLDAQYWGVPQRRRRIYLIADLAGGRAGKVLFESEGLSGYSAESFRSWQRAAGSAAACTGTTGADTVKAAGFCTEHSAKSRSVGYEEERSPTLRTGVVPAAVAVENHPADGRIKIEEDDTIQTLTSRMGTGGMNVPLLLKIRAGCEGGGKGPLIQEDRSATLSCNNDQTLFEPCSWDGKQTVPTLTAHNAGGSQRMPDKNHFNCVIQPFGISAKDSNAMKSPNPHAGIYEADTARTLDKGGGSPTCNQGGIAVVCCKSETPGAVCIQGSMIGRTDKNGPQGDGINKDVSFTLNTADRHAVYAVTTGSFTQVTEEKAPTLLSRDYKDAAAVTEPAYGIGRDAFNQGKNAKYKPSVEEELQPTMTAKGPGAVAVGFYPQMKAEGMSPTEEKSVTLVNGTNPGYQNGVIDNVYTVRRLTPTECARLQGFPDWWCSGLETSEPDEEEISRWSDVFDVFREITSPGTKPRSVKQIEKWLKAPYSDSAAYKMWGNGVALPCVFFVLAGIVYYTQNEAV